MKIEGILKNFAIYFDGRSYIGKAKGFQPPELTLKTEEYLAGGMIAAKKVKMGLETMTTTFTLGGYHKEVIAKLGLAEGNTPSLTARGALEDSDGTIHSVEAVMRGQVTSLKPSEWKATEMSELPVEMDLDYYEWRQDGEVIHQIDIENMIWVVDGTDQLQAQRDALGI